MLKRLLDRLRRPGAVAAGRGDSPPRSRAALLELARRPPSPVKISMDLFARAGFEQRPGARAWARIAAGLWTLGRDKDFVATLRSTLDAAGWPSHARAVVGAWLDGFEDPKPLHPGWSVFESIEIAGVTSARLGELLDSPRAAALRELRLSCSMTPETWRRVASYARLPQLRLLALRDNEDSATFAIHASLPALEILDLQSAELEDEELVRAAASLPPLRELYLDRNPDLNSNAITSAGLAQALRAQPQLEVLDLTDNEEIDDEGARAIAETCSKGPLRALSLSGTEIGPAGFSRLGDGPLRASLDRLILPIWSAEELRGAWSETRAAEPWRLRELQLWVSDGDIISAVAAVLARCPALARLQLFTAFRELTDDERRALQRLGASIPRLELG